MSADPLRDNLAKMLRRLGTANPHEREVVHGKEPICAPQSSRLQAIGTGFELSIRPCEIT